tara:strand:- start:92 stop:730 length:639 start_codon:yes stop_codon:yes gene_type:complete
MSYQFKTSQQWKHQVVPEEKGFYWDSNFYEYSKVFSIRGIPSKTIVNFAHYKHLDDFIFEIYMLDGKVLVQEIKTLHAAKAIAFLGNTSDVGKELSYLCDLLLYHTFDIRYEKYLNYYKRYNRILLATSLDGDTLSAKYGDIYFNKKFYGCYLPNNRTLEVSQDGNSCSIRFQKISSNFFSSDRYIQVDIFDDYDIRSQALDAISLGLDKFT